MCGNFLPLSDKTLQSQGFEEILLQIVVRLYFLLTMKEKISGKGHENGGREELINEI